jgi:hypothetical protein
MLDLIVAKALAKTVDERYQNMAEFAHDLNEVKQQMLLSKPRSAVIAKNAPSQPKPVTLDALGLGVGRYQKKDEADEAATPLQLAKKFDSFDATMKVRAIHFGHQKNARLPRGDHRPASLTLRVKCNIKYEHQGLSHTAIQKNGLHDALHLSHPLAGPRGGRHHGHALTL